MENQDNAESTDHDWRHGSNQPYYVWDPHRRIGDADVSRRPVDAKRWDGELRDPDYVRIYQRKLLDAPFAVEREPVESPSGLALVNHELQLPPPEAAHHNEASNLR